MSNSVESYRSSVNSGLLFLLVGGALLFITIMCLIFLVKSYRAGIKIGMEKKVLRKVIISSATFTVLPSISILLGVIALSGTLGIPYSWLRLSVIGALQYELNVAAMAAESIGLSGLKVTEMSMGSFTTIALVMAAGILGSLLCCLFFLGRYLKKIRGNQAADTAAIDAKDKKPGFGAYATTAMFIGLCSAYIGAYIGDAIRNQNVIPLLTAGVAALTMAIFEYFTQKKNIKALDNFSVAGSMLIAMAAAVCFGQVIGG
ncbi:DUF5058 family protein [Lachnospiraceae bacterium OttesenSCG-928-J05]|nr:DUF5058 family protein [Lachnospiraceae bacterium OttesenSCG-928-J05]